MDILDIMFNSKKYKLKPYKMDDTDKSYKMDNILGITPIMSNILLYLDDTDIINISSTNKAWRKLCSSQDFWTYYYRYHQLDDDFVFLTKPKHITCLHWLKLIYRYDLLDDPENILEKAIKYNFIEFTDYVLKLYLRATLNDTVILILLKGINSAVKAGRLEILKCITAYYPYLLGEFNYQDLYSTKVCITVDDLISDIFINCIASREKNNVDIVDYLYKEYNDLCCNQMDNLDIHDNIIKCASLDVIKYLYENKKILLDHEVYDINMYTKARSDIIHGPYDIFKYFIDNNIININVDEEICVLDIRPETFKYLRDNNLIVLDPKMFKNSRDLKRRAIHGSVDILKYLVENNIIVIKDRDLCDMFILPIENFIYLFNMGIIKLDPIDLKHDVDMRSRVLNDSSDILKYLVENNVITLRRGDITYNF